MEANNTVDQREELRQSLRVSSLEHTFDNFKVLPGTEQAYDAFKELADGGDKPFLLCYGGVGNGKTHLLVATAIRLRERGIFCRVYSWGDIVNNFKAHLAFEAIPSYRELFQRFAFCPVLLVDDVGLGTTGSEWEFGQLEDIVNLRYREGLITVIVTNLDLGQLPERVVSRFSDPDLGVIVLNKGADYRRRRGNNA